MLSIVVLSLLVLISSVVSYGEESQPVKYDHYTLYRVWSKESPFIIEEDLHGGLILSKPNVQSSFYDILIPPNNISEFESDIKSRQWTFKVLNKNVQETIDEERLLNRMDLRSGGPYSWDRYQSYEEIVEWMKDLPNQFPDNVTLYNIGKSYELRDTYVMKLSNRENNTAIFLEAGLHAREWITIATSTWIFNKLLHCKNPEVVRLATEYDWYLLAVGNPDGYVYTSQKDRMWRKNRRPSGLPFSICSGVDLNRNWGYHWRETDPIIGFVPCQDAYPGSDSMSEVETRNINNFMKTIANKVKLYISFHAYSQLLLWPEGHTAKRIDEYKDYERIGNATVEAIKRRYGTVYHKGSIKEVMYSASGSTIDYMRATYKIPLAFCFELRPGREAPMGFVLDPKLIIETSKETYDGIEAMIGEGHELGYL